MSASALAEKSSDRPDPRIERSRAKLLAAATDLLVERGPAALTVDNVAERSGVAKSTLYRHWPSRTALMIDVLRANMPCTPPIDPTAGFEQCLRNYMRAIADSMADPEWARIMPALFALKHHLPEIDQLTVDDRDEKHAQLTELLERGVAEGLIPDGLDVHSVATCLFGPILMCALLGESQTAHAAGDFALERFLDSYRPDGG